MARHGYLGKMTMIVRASWMLASVLFLGFVVCLFLSILLGFLFVCFCLFVLFLFITVVVFVLVGSLVVVVVFSGYLWVAATCSNNSCNNSTLFHQKDPSF